MAKNTRNIPVFADKEHLLFTAQVLAGEVNLGERLSPYHAGDMLVPLSHLSESICDTVQGIIEVNKQRNDEATERESRVFQEQYDSELKDKIEGYRKLGLAKEEVHYNENHIPILTYQQSLFNEPINPFQYLAFQGSEGMLGKYVELVLARILNGTIIDLNGVLPDIAVETSSGEMLYIESKAARFSNREKYCAPSGKMRYVSRNGFFAKRNQIHSSLATENGTPGTTTYMALVDYDFVDGANMTFTEFVNGHPNTFGKIQHDYELKSLPERLRDTVIIKKVLIIPTWAAFLTWNANIMRTRPLDKFTQGRLYKDERHPVAQYFDMKHVDTMKDYLTQRQVPRNTHTISGIQETPIQIETFGHIFLPFDTITL